MTVFILAWFIGTWINAFFCFYVWQRRADQGALSKPLDKALVNSTEWFNIQKKVDYILSVDFINTITESVGRRVNSALGGPIKHQNDEQREIAQDLQKKVDYILSVDFINTITESVGRRVNSALGGHIKHQNDEQREIAQDLASVEIVQYPAVQRVMTNVNAFIEAGIVKDTWVERVNKLLKSPAAPEILPRLETVCMQLLQHQGSPGVGRISGGQPLL
jgi:Zn-finger protein